MTRNFAVLLVLLAACAAPGAGDSDSEPMYLFVQTAQSATLEGDQLTLTGVSPSMLWFTDRPVRSAGHCEVGNFLEAMTDDPDADNFGEDPPNATLSVFEGETITDVVVTLLDPKLVGSTLTYRVKLLDGPDTLRGGPASLFIDPIRRRVSREKVVVVRPRRHPRVVHPVVVHPVRRR